MPNEDLAIKRKGVVVCSSIKSCGVCSQNARCGWCTLDNTCVDGNFLAPQSGRCVQSIGEYQWGQCSVSGTQASIYSIILVLSLTAAVSMGISVYFDLESRAKAVNSIRRVLQRWRGSGSGTDKSKPSVV